jgi:hypothetical protein
MYPLIFFSFVTLNNWNAHTLKNYGNYQLTCKIVSSIIPGIYLIVTIWQLR